MDATLRQCLESFGHRTRALFETRPYWLVNEHRVVGAFIDAALETPDFLPPRGALVPERISTEAECGGEKKVDLVLRRGSAEVAVEFKGWNIVTKYRPDTLRTEGANVSGGYVDAQLTAIAKDVNKLARIAHQNPEALCLLVVYAQGPLGAEHARRFTGRKQKIDFSAVDHVTSADALNRWIEQNQGEPLAARLTEVSAARADFRCAAETNFVLRVFTVGVA